MEEYSKLALASFFRDLFFYFYSSLNVIVESVGFFAYYFC